MNLAGLVAPPPAPERSTSQPQGAGATPASGGGVPSAKRLNPLRRLTSSPATLGLITLTALVFLLQLATTQFYGVDLVMVLGAKVNEAIAVGQVWRLITPIFIHAGVIHLLVNMYSLYALGPAVESFFGSRRMLVVFLLSGIAGVAFSLAFSPYPSVGASGAIFGLLGALGAFLFLHRSTLGRWGSVQLRQIIFVAVLNLGLGLTPGIDNWGHLGGLLAGTTLAWFLGPRLEPVWVDAFRFQLRDRRRWRDVWPGAMVAAGIIALLAWLATRSPFNGG